jgi:WLM domain
MDYDDILGYLIIGLILFISYKIYSESDIFQLKCVISTVDGDKYCVRERKNIKAAANLLATVTKNMKELVKYVNDRHPDDERIKRLVKKFNPDKIVETLPTSEYTAYSENKGKKIAFCLNKHKEDDKNLIDINTLTFVAIHEMAHITTVSIGHNTEFWDNFKFLLKEAVAAGLYKPINYKKENEEYCGMTITDNPYYN